MEEGASERIDEVVELEKKKKIEWEAKWWVIVARPAGQEMGKRAASNSFSRVSWRWSIFRLPLEIWEGSPSGHIISSGGSTVGRAGQGLD